MRCDPDINSRRWLAPGSSPRRPGPTTARPCRRSRSGRCGSMRRGCSSTGTTTCPGSSARNGDLSFRVRSTCPGRLAKGAAHRHPPRLREGGTSKAQFWAAYVPASSRPRQDGRPRDRRRADRRDPPHGRCLTPTTFEMALTAADDVERIAARRARSPRSSAIEGGVATRSTTSLGVLRCYYRPPRRALHDADALRQASTGPTAATDEPKQQGGLTKFGEECRPRDEPAGDAGGHLARLAPTTMAARIEGDSAAPVIASRTRRRLRPRADHPRNVPDDDLASNRQGEQRRRHGQLLLRASSYAPQGATASTRDAATYARGSRPRSPTRIATRSPPGDAYRKERADAPRAASTDVVDHIEHVIKVAGIDHVGIGSDFDGVTSVPVGLEDVSCYPRLTEGLLRRGYPEPDVHKILGGNVLRALRKAGEVAEGLQRTTRPEVDQPPPPNRGR